MVYLYYHVYFMCLKNIEFQDDDGVRQLHGLILTVYSNKAYSVVH